MLLKARHVAFKVAISECVVGKHRPQQALQIAIGAIGTGLCGTLVAADGRPGGVDEHAAVADLVMAEQAAEQRVVPGLGQFIVQARVDQAYVGTFHQRPLLDLQQYLVIERITQPAVDLADLLFVKVDPSSGCPLAVLPTRLLEALAGAEGDTAKMLAIVVEAIEDHPGDLAGRPVLGHAGHLGAG
ncbi:hypothetical protein D3C76_1097250 [compost metagenome]